ncbi:MAG TPA: YceI family protein [Acidimicrobiales bacterium]|nr:YceI family protein [Acidimicrobiales bacterium]
MTTQTTTSPVTRTVDGVEVPASGRYAIDASHSHVGFSVRHVMVSRTKGRFADVTGEVTIGEDPLDSSVEVEIQAASIDTRDETRDGHLRSPDFLDVEQFPTLTYRSRQVIPAGRGRWTVEGDLTVRGVTRPVPLEVTFEGGAKDPWGGERIGFTASAELDREAFGLTWNQALETGGVLVGKTVKIEIEAEAVHQ